MTQSRPVPIEVEAVLPVGDLPGIAEALIESRVSEEIGELIAALGLPGIPHVKVAHDRIDAPSSGTAPVLFIEGLRCRQETSYPWQDDTGGIDPLVRWCAKAAHLNRQLLLTPRVLCRLAESYSLQAVALLPELMRYGGSLNMACEVAGEVNPRLCGASRTHQTELAIANRLPRLVTIEMGAGLYEVAARAAGRVDALFCTMRDGMFYELGVVCPPCRTVANRALGAFEFRCHVRRVRGPVEETVGANECLVNDSPARLQSELDVEGRAARNPEGGMPWAIVSGEEAAERCVSGGLLTKWDSLEHMVLSVTQLLRANAGLFVTIAEVQRMLSRLSEAFPLLIVDVLERWSPCFVGEVLRALVRENVSIRDLRSVMEAMLAVNGTLSGCTGGGEFVTPAVGRLSRWRVDRLADLNAEQWADCVRVEMKRTITSGLARGSEMTVVETSAATEAHLRACGREFREEARGMIEREVGAFGQEGRGGQSVVVVTAFDLRRALREAIEIEVPAARVMCREELEEGLAWRDRRVIGWPKEKGASERPPPPVTTVARN